MKNKFLAAFFLHGPSVLTWINVCGRTFLHFQKTAASKAELYSLYLTQTLKELNIIECQEGRKIRNNDLFKQVHEKRTNARYIHHFGPCHTAVLIKRVSACKHQTVLDHIDM